MTVFFEVKIHLKLLCSGIGMECETEYRVKKKKKKKLRKELLKSPCSLLIQF